MKSLTVSLFMTASMMASVTFPLSGFAEESDFLDLSPLSEDAPRADRDDAEALRLDNAGSARSSARSWDSLRTALPLARVPSAGSWATLQNAFRTMRDDRFLDDPAHPRHVRRITWLYPDDGCYMRADVGSRRLQSRGYTSPAKVFAFGNLRASTRNHPRGRVGWWYHVAPALRVGATIYVLDPSIAMNQAIPIQTWLGKMSTDPSSVKVSICSAGAYGPNSTCVRPSSFASSESSAWEHDTQSEALRAFELARDRDVQEFSSSVIRRFLSREWERVKSLGWNPYFVLGDSPPWFGANAPAPVSVATPATVFESASALTF